MITVFIMLHLHGPSVILKLTLMVGMCCRFLSIFQGQGKLSWLVLASLTRSSIRSFMLYGIMTSDVRGVLCWHDRLKRSKRIESRTNTKSKIMDNHLPSRPVFQHNCLVKSVFVCAVDYHYVGKQINLAITSVACVPNRYSFWYRYPIAGYTFETQVSAEIVDRQRGQVRSQQPSICLYS